MARSPSKTLTHRELLILDLVQDGIPDAEIAVRLGTGVEEVKDRVRSLQHRLGAVDRASLASWQRTLPRDPEAPTVAGPLPAPGRHTGHRLPAWLLLVAGALAGLAVALAGAALWPASRSSPGPLGTVPEEPRPHPSATPTADPRPAAAVAPMKLPWATFGNATGFPQDTVVVVTERCWQCAGPAFAVVRYWKNSGEVHRTVLFRPEMVGDSSGSTIWSFAVTPDGRRMVAGVCVSWSCDWHDQGTTFQTAVALYESRDTGTTWSLLGEVSADISIAALSPDQLLLRGSSRSRGVNRSELLSWPTLEPASLPGLAADTLQPSAQWLGSAGWAWTGSERGGVYDGTGTQQLVGLEAEGVLVQPDGYAVSIVTADGSPAILFTDRSWAVTGGFRLPTALARVVAALPDGVLVGNAEIPASVTGTGTRDWRPVLITSAGIVTPLAGPPELREASIEGARPGPVVEVDAPGTCAEARSKPGAGEVVSCVADQMLLVRGTAAAAADDAGQNWLPVVLPGAGAAWVRADSVLE